VFVLEHGQMTEGNKLLLKKGALGFPYPINVPPIRLPDWLNEKAASQPSSPNQLRLF
jgi:hypothetical protein